MNDDTTTQFERLGNNFIEEFLALLTDFYEINDEKLEFTKKTINELKEKKLKSNDLSYEQLKQLRHDNLKHEQFRIAMFNYMNAIFERNINDLFKFSIAHDEIVKRRYLEKFIEIDSSKILQGQKPIRNAAFELMNSGDKEQIYLSYFQEVTSSLPPLINYQHFFSIPDKNMWRENFLKFDFNEIRARRNLLTHRGTTFDKEYVDTVNRATTTSKNAIDPNNRIKHYFEKKLFTFPQIELNFNNNLSSLIDTEKPIPVAITHKYFIFSFSCLLKIYMKIWSYAAKSDSLVINVTHDLMIFGSKFKTKTLFSLAENITTDYIHCFGSDNIHDFLKANYLLCCRDVHNTLRSYGKELKTKPKHEEDFVEYFKSKLEDPKFSLLMNIYNNQLNSALDDLKRCKGLPKNAESWFLFEDLKTMDEFKELINKATRD
jgi:hypothetical protein